MYTTRTFTHIRTRPAFPALSVLASPFSRVSFLSSYIGDVMTSTVKVSLDFSYTVCWLSQGFWLPTSDKNISHKEVRCYLLFSCCYH